MAEILFVIFFSVLARGSLSQWRHLEREGRNVKNYFFFFFWFSLLYYSKRSTFPFCFATFTFAREEQEVNVDVKKLI